MSHAVLEQPIRTSPRLDGHPAAVVGIGLALSLLVGIVVAPRILAADGVAAGGIDWRSAAADEPEIAPCDLDEAPVCILVPGDGPRVLLAGDSHAAALAPALEPIARRQGFELAAVFMEFCPWTRGIEYTLMADRCYERQDVLYRERVPAYDPDLVILSHRSVDDPQQPMSTADRDEGALLFDGQRDVAVARAVGRSLTALGERGIPAVVVEPIPAPPVDDLPIDCLAEGGDPARCHFQATAGPLPEEEAFRAEAGSSDQVWSLDLDPLVCPALPRCDPVVDGEVVLHDSNHFTTAFSATLADAIEAWMVDEGVLPAP